MKPTTTNLFPNLDYLISASKLTGRSGRVFENLGARSTINNLITLQNLFNYYQPKRTLEVGLSFGASGLLFTNAHHVSGRPPTGQHVALDPFQASVWDDVGLLQIEEAGLGGYLEFQPTYSCFALPGMLEQGREFDLIYVDGSHLFEDVFIDAYYSSRLLSQGGIVAFDDCTDPHVAKVVRFLQRNCTDWLEEIDLKPYRQKTAGLSTYDIAKLAGRVQMRGFQRIGEIAGRKWDARFIQF